VGGEEKGGKDLNPRTCQAFPGRVGGLQKPHRKHKVNQSEKKEEGCGPQYAKK